MGQNLDDFWYDDDVLDTTAKGQSLKEITDNLKLFKNKFYFVKYNKRMRGQAQDLGKYLQKTHLK